MKCRVKADGDGVRRWIELTTNMVVAIQRPGERAVDLRERPPFHPILPCPYCGVAEDKAHVHVLHVNPQLGTPIAETK